VIVVDTNVISELMRGEPHPAVLSWVAAQPRSLLYASYVSQAEILYGIAALPELDFGHFWRKTLKRLNFNQKFKPLISPAEFRKWPKSSSEVHRMIVARRILASVK
jgi:predicted nucleic acid-binding protein